MQSMLLTAAASMDGLHWTSPLHLLCAMQQLLAAAVAVAAGHPLVAAATVMTGSHMVAAAVVHPHKAIPMHP